MCLKTPFHFKAYLHTLMSKKRAGRPPGSTRITTELVDTIEQLIRAGNGIYKAAELAGISYPTLFRWCKRGKEQKSGTYYDFYKAVNCVREEKRKREVEEIKARHAARMAKRQAFYDDLAKRHLSFNF